MSHQDPVPHPRHRQHWSQASPARMVSGMVVAWLLVTVGLWVGLRPGTGPQRSSAPPPASPPAATTGAEQPASGGPATAVPDSAPATARPPGAGPVGPAVIRTAGPRPPARTAATAGRPAESTGPLLTLTTSAVPSVVNLSAEGTLDWVHWGLHDPGSMTRKANGSHAISDEGTSGPRERYDTNPKRFSWRGGMPDQTVTETTTGVYACGVDSGFAVAVAAGPRTRVLRFYAGVGRATGRLEVSLSGTGLTRNTTMSTTSPFAHTARITIAFRAPAGGRLVLHWFATEVFNQYCGDVNMQAATLR